jgi:hypothetical protein
MWIKCSENFVVSLVVNLVGSSNCSRIDKVYDKVYDKVSFFMQSKQNWAECPDHRWRGHSARRLSSAELNGFLPAQDG